MPPELPTSLAPKPLSGPEFPPSPPWDGRRNLNGRTVLIHTEQGFCDAISVSPNIFQQVRVQDGGILGKIILQWPNTRACPSG